MSTPKVIAAVPCRSTPQPICEEAVHATLKHAGADAVFIKPAHAPRDWNRNFIIWRFLHHYSNESEWLFFVDDDTTPPEDALSKLMALNKAVAVGVQPLYLVGSILANVSPGCPDFSPDDGGGVVWPQWHMWDQSRPPFRVGACGFGCVLIHRSALLKPTPEQTHYRHFVQEVDSQIRAWDRDEPNGIKGKLAWPWFAEDYGRVDGYKSQTEDIWFCRRAHASGVDIWCDPSVVCGHHKTVNLADFIPRSAVKVQVDAA